VTLTDDVREACRLAATAAGDGPSSAAIAAMTERLDGPLRVAIAGRVKAGKSTLLNALVGERLAPTDAGECTRIISWYHEGPTYEVSAHRVDGQVLALPFQRVDGTLQIDMGGVDPAEIDRLDVGWPSARLHHVTLIDTPGLGSIDDPNSRRSREFLALDHAKPSDADAVVYLMRHVHRSDAEFLAAFMDRDVASTSPINAVAVLSRADEIGGARLDSMTSAARIAERWRVDSRLSSLCADIVPVAGLLAETAQTWREDEAAAVRTLAATPPDELDRMLLSVDDWCEPASGAVTVQLRQALLGRLGMFGLRYLISLVQSGALRTATEMSAGLLEVSGIAALRRLIDERFAPCAQILKARVALASLRSIARGLAPANPAGAQAIEREVERIEATTLEFAVVSLAHLVKSGTVRFSGDEAAEFDTLFTRSLELRAPASVAAADVNTWALAGAQRWRTRAGDPLADSAVVQAAETMARAYETIFLRQAGPSSKPS
jgi:hypothetical protein